jgi:hypothetical protein
MTIQGENWKHPVPTPTQTLRLLDGWFVRFTFVSQSYRPTLLYRHGQADSLEKTVPSSGIATRERCILGMSSPRL